MRTADWCDVIAQWPNTQDGAKGAREQCVVFSKPVRCQDHGVCGAAAIPSRNTGGPLGDPLELEGRSIACVVGPAIQLCDCERMQQKAEELAGHGCVDHVTGAKEMAP